MAVRDALRVARPYGPEHREFASSFRSFLEREVTPHFEDWERDGIVPREVFSKAGEAGFLGMEVPEEFGGAGVDDFWFNAVLHEELGAVGAAGFGVGLTLHNDVCAPYFLRYADQAQRQRWLPGIASGELLTAIAMTEPGAGSDLAGLTTTAVRDGDSYVVNGSKTFVTNGINADLVVVVVRTDPDERHAGLSLLVVERDTPGFVHGRNLQKLGMHSQDTAELFFDDARVPSANVLGEVGGAFRQLMENLPRERLSIALAAVGAARGAVEWTVPYVRDRQAFGQAIGTFQAVRFALAEAFSEVEVAQAYVDQCVERLNLGTLSSADAAIAKWWCSEVQARVIDQCLQLHGGYGYMMEYPIARAYLDARVTRIYGGTNEIMKEIVARSLDL
jgi:alkylation response protein AidB-like acyl-CoA dehydrogenase